MPPTCTAVTLRTADGAGSVMMGGTPSVQPSNSLAQRTPTNQFGAISAQHTPRGRAEFGMYIGHRHATSSGLGRSAAPSVRGWVCGGGLLLGGEEFIRWGYPLVGSLAARRSPRKSAAAGRARCILNRESIDLCGFCDARPVDAPDRHRIRWQNPTTRTTRWTPLTSGEPTCRSTRSSPGSAPLCTALACRGRRSQSTCSCSRRCACRGRSGAGDGAIDGLPSGRPCRSAAAPFPSDCIAACAWATNIGHRGSDLHACMCCWQRMLVIISNQLAPSIPVPTSSIR